MRREKLPVYDYVKGYPLHDVPAYRCASCGEVFFTEEDADEMEARTRKLEEQEFGFERRITVSGGSMVVSIPHELARHLHLARGQVVRVIPVSRQGFLVKKTKR